VGLERARDLEGGAVSKRCVCCGIRLTASEAAARRFDKAGEIRWCLGCWDNDPMAVVLYNAPTLPTPTREGESE
jgi:hypothetical protein